MKKFICIMCFILILLFTSCNNSNEAVNINTPNADKNRTTEEEIETEIIKIAEDEEWITYKNHLIEFSAPKELNFTQNSFGWFSLNYKDKNIAYVFEEDYQHDDLPELFFRNMCDVLESEVLDNYFCPVLRKKYKCYFNVHNKPVIQYELLHAFFYNQKDRKAVLLNFNLKYVEEDTIQKIVDSVKLVQ